jgi:hypothetical protein
MVFEYTKPRGPVAAMYASPGPCYGLPSLVGQKNHDPRSAHNRAPAYPFGLKHGKTADECGPGPAYLPDPNSNRTRPPAYTMVGKRGEGRRFQGPGPMDYDVIPCESRNISSDNTRAPAYTFGLNIKHRSAEDTPGPNKYNTIPPSPVESNRRRAPSYTLVGRRTVGSFHEDLNKTPGPGAYTNIDLKTYLTRSPCYTISHRNAMPGDNTRRPGPGTYNTSQIWGSKREPPRYSFGIRHSPYVAPLILSSDD